MAISMNGFNTNKSLSPDTIMDALPAIGNSRNMSSFGSRHAFTFSLILKWIDNDKTEDTNSTLSLSVRNFLKGRLF